MIKKLLFCVLIFFIFITPAFPWQVVAFKEKNLPVNEESRIILNLVFAPLGYQKGGEFKKDVFLIVNRLKSVPPFDEFKGFRVYLLHTIFEESAMLFKKCESFPYLKVENNFIQDIEKRIGGVYKLVILNKEGDVSAGELSGIKDTSLIILGRNSFGGKNRLAKAFLHELGHSLGLREENPSSFQLVIAGKPNCAPDKKTAVKWWGDMAKAIDGVGYFKIQSGGRTFIKPTSRSIMNNPFESSGYGPVNERYLCRELRVKKRE